MSASCNLIGRNEQETIRNYAKWSISWLKDISYDLMLTMQKLKTIYNGGCSNRNMSIEYNALRELVGSLSENLKSKYYNAEVTSNRYDEREFMLKRIYDNAIEIDDELKNDKPIKIERDTLLHSDKKMCHKINIPGNMQYYQHYIPSTIFYEIDNYIHRYFGDVENPFETEFSLVFTDKSIIDYLNQSNLRSILYSQKRPVLCEKLDKNDASLDAQFSWSVLSCLVFNYPKISFEYIETVAVKYELDSKAMKLENT